MYDIAFIIGNVIVVSLSDNHLKYLLFNFLNFKSVISAVPVYWDNTPLLLLVPKQALYSLSPAIGLAPLTSTPFLITVGKSVFFTYSFEIKYILSSVSPSNAPA